MSTHKLLLSAKNLCVDYSHHGLAIPIVQDINLNIHEGETIAISGESGSGKSVCIVVDGIDWFLSVV